MENCIPSCSTHFCLAAHFKKEMLASTQVVFPNKKWFRAHIPPPIDLLRIEAAEAAGPSQETTGINSIVTTYYII